MTNRNLRSTTMIKTLTALILGLTLGFLTGAPTASLADDPPISEGNATDDYIPFVTAFMKQPCQTEDDTHNCYWDARYQGNGGHSFYSIRVGLHTLCTKYISPRYDHKHGECHQTRMPHWRHYKRMDGHRDCWAMIGDTTYGHCRDGYRFSS